MRRLGLTFSALLPLLDFLTFLAAAVTAYALRYSEYLVEIRPILTETSFGDIIKLKDKSEARIFSVSDLVVKPLGESLCNIDRIKMHKQLKHVLADV